ncbi:hypothetical protein EAF00_007305 [Botryotinia globosa]|nr:hypothetical protein EAF00_007305 [Botryotinia globosa]
MKEHYKALQLSSANIITVSKQRASPGHAASNVFMTAPYTSHINSLALTHPVAMIANKLVSEYAADQVAAQKLMDKRRANFGVDASIVIRPEAFEKAALDYHCG